MAWRAGMTMLIGILLFAGAPGAAVGGNTSAARKQVESSLRVSGSVTIAPDGSVQAHTLDEKAPLGDALVRFLDDTIGKWRFEPVKVDGKVVTARVPMHLRLVARNAGDGKFNVSVVSTYFGNGGANNAIDQLSSIQLTPPEYPQEALYMGGKGTVYLVLQVGRDGQVRNVDAEQVNLRVLGSPREMDKLRKLFTAASLRAAKRWTFRIPTSGEYAGNDASLVRVPVEFVLRGPGESKPGTTQWDSYVPGPRNTRMPWAEDKLRIAGNPEALPEGGVYPLRQGATLLNPPAS